MVLDPKHLINLKSEETRKQIQASNPVQRRWWLDPDFRRWEEAKDIAARWGISQRLVRRVDSWMKEKGITAACEFQALWKSQEAARKSFNFYLNNHPER